MKIRKNTFYCMTYKASKALGRMLWEIGSQTQRDEIKA